MLRNAILVALTVVSIGVISEPANAEDRDLGKLAPGSDKLTGLCNEHDGTTWASADGANWGCSYKGGGGIMCDKDTGCLETTREKEDDLPWGLLGLLGLAGLLGLKRRDRDNRVDVNRTGTAGTSNTM